MAIVERELVASECSYYACIPSKTLLRPGEAVDAALAAPRARQAVRCRPASVSKNGAGFVVSFEDGSTLEGERLLVATVRRSRVSHLGLEELAMGVDRRGVQVDAA